MRTGAQRAVAAVVLLLAIACVALMVEAGRRIYQTIGPSHALAAPDGSLYVVSHGAIHVFGPDGARRATIDLKTLGLSRTPSDIALHADGRLVLMDPDTSLLRRCRLPAGPCESLDLGLAHVNVQQLMPLNSAKVAIDESARRYFVSDNAGHSLVMADFSGHVLARSARGAVWYPNHLFVPSPGLLSVVDTNHHRIATFEVHENRIGRVVHQVFAGSSAVTRPGRRWPFDSMPLPGGGTAVLVADDGMRDADLEILDAKDHPVRRIDLGADSDPFDIEWWNGRIVVADATRYELVAVDEMGRAAADFPPADFRAELAREQGRVWMWRRVQAGTRIAIVAIPLIAILVLWRLGEPLFSRPAGPIPTTPGERKPGTQWITYDPAFLARERRRGKWATWYLGICFLGLLFVTASHLRSADLSDPALPLVGSAALAWLLLVALLLRYVMREVGRRRSAFRLGASDEGLVVTAADWRGRATERRVEWKDVYLDGSRLLAGSGLVMLRMPIQGDFFDRRAIADAILTRMPPGNYLTAPRFTLQTMRARPGHAAVLAALIVALVIVVWKDYFRHL